MQVPPHAAGEEIPQCRAGHSYQHPYIGQSPPFFPLRVMIKHGEGCFPSAKGMKSLEVCFGIFVRFCVMGKTLRRPHLPWACFQPQLLKLVEIFQILFCLSRELSNPPETCWYCFPRETKDRKMILHYASLRFFPPLLPLGWRGKPLKILNLQNKTHVSHMEDSGLA